MKPEQYFLDVSIIIYAAGKLNEYKETCTKVLHNIRSGKLSAAVDTEIVQEILYRYHPLGLYDEAVKLA